MRELPDARFVRSASGTLLLSLAIEDRKSTFRNSCGGIAQLVERQLCKLEVRGSNPLASKSLKGVKAKLNNQAHFGCTTVRLGLITTTMVFAGKF
jgi:hypothetical protein